MHKEDNANPPSRYPDPGNRTPADSHIIEAWITNIASQAERDRRGPRLELCFSKDNWDLFPAHKTFFTMFVGGSRYRMSIGKRDGVAHLYVHTNCYDSDMKEVKVTKVLQSAGLQAGDRPRVKVLGRYEFEVVTCNKS